VPHARSSAGPERKSPTLWPRHPDDGIERAIEARRDENEALKQLVVRLSEIVLNDTTDGKK
jgi:hypothetical protein